jgi:predicted Zn finger-like uncharacterized protein
MTADPVSLECPSCRKRLRVPASAAGKTVRCPACKTGFTAQAVAPAVVPIPLPPEPAPAGAPFDFFADDAPPAPAPADAAPADAAPAAAYFTAVEPRNWTPNRVYHVYADRDELVGVWAGNGNDLAMIVGAGTGGLIGGLIGGAIAAKTAKKNARRHADVDGQSLDELRDSHPHNFVLSAEDIDAAEIVPPGFWHRFQHSTAPQVALLKLTAAESRTLAIATPKDLGVAVTMLKALLGDRLDVKVKHRR